MGIFDSLKNMTNQTVKKQCFKGRFGSGKQCNAQKQNICICRLSEKCR